MGCNSIEDPNTATVAEKISSTLSCQLVGSEASCNDVIMFSGIFLVSMSELIAWQARLSNKLGALASGDWWFAV